MRVIPLSASEVIRILHKMGYVLNNSKGRHRIFKHPNKIQQVTVPDHKELKTGTLRNAIKQTGLSIEEFYSYRD